MEDLNATHIIWNALGRPAPIENDGSAIAPRKHAEGVRCAHCGDPSPAYHLSDAISENFTTVRNASRAWPFGGTALCAACVVAAKSLALRSGIFFANATGIWLTPMMPVPNDAVAQIEKATGRKIPPTRPDVLSALFEPPPPPFVACFPLYGIEHGTEGNASRIITPGQAIPRNVLARCQSKHTAIYARTSFSRERYTLQVDDTDEIVVDVAKWRALRDVADGLVAEIRAAGGLVADIKRALTTLEPPRSAPLGLIAEWRARTEPLRPVHRAEWWALFVDLLIVPPLPERAKPEKKKESSK